MENEQSLESKINDNKKNQTISNICNILGIIFCILLIPILIINCLLIIKSIIYPDEVPSVGKYYPLIVLTDSMDPVIKSGDLIICKAIDDEEIDVGTIISFYDPAGDGNAIVTHKVNSIEYNEETNENYYYTQGVNNNIEDRYPVSHSKIIGVYNNIRIPFIGRAIIFLQTPLGIVLCIGLPISLFALAIYIAKRKEYKEKMLLNEKDNKAKIEAMNRIEELEAEIERMKNSKDEK